MVELDEEGAVLGVAVPRAVEHDPYDRPVVKAFLAGKPLPDPPPPLASIAPGLPADVAAIIDRCLQLDAKARPDAATVARVFDQKM